MTDDQSFVTQQAQGSGNAQAAYGSKAEVHNKYEHHHQPTPSQQKRNREQVLKRLRLHYDNLWKQNLSGASSITLKLVEKPDAIHRDPDSAQQTEFPLDPVTSIVQVYDDRSAYELLILGEPGAGKSTLLLELAMLRIALQMRK